jgi:protein N-terminal glutamine amidohydrolase
MLLNSRYYMTIPVVQVPLWCQRAHATAPVIWDYHVVIIWFSPNGDGSVVDLDTTLPFPCPIREYIEKALKPHHPVFVQHPEFRRRFRVVSAPHFLETFASDRSHMISQAPGSAHPVYSSSPPNYPCIRTKDCQNNLSLYLDMRSSPPVRKLTLDSQAFGGFGGLGVVLSEHEFVQLVSGDDGLS